MKHSFLMAMIFSHFFLLFSATADPSTRLSTDWEAGLLDLTITRDVESFSPAERNRLGMEVDQDLIDEFTVSAGSLRISSAMSISDWLNKNPARFPEFIEGVKKLKLKGSSYTRDFSQLTFRYSAMLFPDIAAVFIEHSQGYLPPVHLTFQPAADFTGILIYVKGVYPVQGEERRDRLSPALFPRIWDDQMNLVFSPGMMDASLLLHEGAVCYSDDLTSPEVKDRIGPNPIRILTRRIFGLVPTDPVIPASDARAVLNSQKGKELLSTGRIAFIYGE